MAFCHGEHKSYDICIIEVCWAILAGANGKERCPTLPAYSPEATHAMKCTNSGSKLQAIVGPVQQRLPLTGTAERITRLAIPQDRNDVPPKGFPALDLAPILFRQPSAHEVAAVPLKPCPRVILMDPAILPLYG